MLYRMLEYFYRIIASYVQFSCANPGASKEKGGSYIYLIGIAKMKVKLCILYERSVLHAKLSYMLNERGKTISLLK